MTQNDMPRSSRLKQWSINIVIIIVVTIVMLIAGEGFVRWLDGYELSNVELERDSSAIEADE